MTTPLVAVIRWCKLSRRCAVRKCPRRWHFASAARAAAILLQQAPSITTGRNRMAYHLEGQLLKVCDCRVLCPCWIGEDPDNGTCDSVLAYHFDAGMIDGGDLAGGPLPPVQHIPGMYCKAISASPYTSTRAPRSRSR